MVFQKRSGFGFNGYQIPTMPRGSRSARGRRWAKKSTEENQMYAFELLATVAGNLLLEEENSHSPSPGSSSRSPPEKDIVKKEHLYYEKKPFKIESCDQGSCDEVTLARKGSPQGSTSGGGKSPVAVVKSNVSGKTAFTNESKVQNSSEFRAKKVECPIGSLLQIKRQKSGNGSSGTVSDLFCMEDPMDLDAKPPPLISSDSSVEVPQYRNNVTYSSSPIFKGDEGMTDAEGEDEENSSGCTQPSKHFGSQKIGDRRIKKITASKFWKVGPTLLKDGEFYSHDAETKAMFRNRKMCCTRRRTQRSCFKRRQLFQRSPVSDASPSYKSFENAKEDDTGASGANLHGDDNDTWPAMASQKLSPNSEEYKVKLRIKSFKVPELFIEMPETATVGSLKRTVLETVNAMLENGLRVGFVYQGKKVRDDSKTLLQTGIARGDKQHDSIGFTLEPSPSKPPQQLPSYQDPHAVESPESLQPLARIPAITTTTTTSDSTLVVASGPDDSAGPPPSPPDHQRDRYSARPLAVVEPSSPSPSPSTPGSSNPATPPSKALVPVTSGEDEALAVVLSSCHRKSKRSELVQRRIRRPFSVVEVEALVQAVENLGTGRWRDVKIRAFENVKHRTYVDLKDKWKTLVHTARISPQQRRGEPVPQELLDRVLYAHAYWSQQQAKLQAKPQPPPKPEHEQCLLLL